MKALQGQQKFGDILPHTVNFCLFKIF